MQIRNKKHWQTSSLIIICLLSILLSIPENVFAESLKTTGSLSDADYDKKLVNWTPSVRDFNLISPKDLPQKGRIEEITLSIPQLDGRKRNFQIYLPPDYDSSDKAYPVFYLFDGQNLFNPLPGSVGDYLIDETLDRLYKQGKLGGLIVVGINHNYDNEWSEYLPWINENMYDWVRRNNSAKVEGGEGFAFTDFIAQTLKPEIDSRYRTLTDKQNTAIGGFCRMGLIPLVAAIEYPDIYGHVMAMSPAVWMAEDGGRWLSSNNLINYINDNTIPKDVNFYIDIGTDESSGDRPPVRDQDGNRITYPRAYVEGAEALTIALKNGGVPDENLVFQIFEDAQGKRDIWAQRFDDVVLWFFGIEHNQPAPESTKTPVVKPTRVDPEDGGNEQDHTISLPVIQDLGKENGSESVESGIKLGIIIGSIFFGFVLVLILWFFKRNQ